MLRVVTPVILDTLIVHVTYLLTFVQLIKEADYWRIFFQMGLSEARRMGPYDNDTRGQFDTESIR